MCKISIVRVTIEIFLKNLVFFKIAKDEEYEVQKSYKVRCKVNEIFKHFITKILFFSKTSWSIREADFDNFCQL